MSSKLFAELEVEHKRMIDASLLGDPPISDLKNFYRKLVMGRKQINHPSELRILDMRIMYWKGFVRQTGETDVLSDEAADRHIRNRT